MNIIETTLQVNKFAQRARHLKTFSKCGLVKSHALCFITSLFVPAKNILDTPIFTKIWRSFLSAKSFFTDILPISPQRRLLFNAGIVVIISLAVTSFSNGATFTPAAMSYSDDYIAAYSLPGDILVSDVDGYLVKINPQTQDSNRIGLTDYAVHTIENGETLSAIAMNYGVTVKTIMWENGIYNANSIRSGQSLIIPPVDGISYKVNSGDNLEKIAKKYEISVDSIVAQNGLDSEVIQKGQSLFLPGAEPLYPTVAVDYRATTVNRADRSISTAAPSTDAPAAGKFFIYPTRGKVSQGFRSGHYAIDIADRSKPAVWAAGGGTVEKASTGTWGGGYGNHVIIDHGNGLKTLYGHLSTVNVYEGQWVDQGTVIGIMGNTGRVYGATGIHLHWEVILNGIKQNPYNYF